MSTKHTPGRFRISQNLPPAMKKQGYRFEVVDSTHPSDGGPVAISWHATREDAEAAIAKATGSAA